MAGLGRTELRCHRKSVLCLRSVWLKSLIGYTGDMGPPTAQPLQGRLLCSSSWLPENPGLPQLSVLPRSFSSLT